MVGYFLLIMSCCLLLTLYLLLFNCCLVLVFCLLPLNLICSGYLLFLLHWCYLLVHRRVKAVIFCILCILSVDFHTTLQIPHFWPWTGLDTSAKADMMCPWIWLCKVLRGLPTHVLVWSRYTSNTDSDNVHVCRLVIILHRWSCSQSEAQDWPQCWGWSKMSVVLRVMCQDYYQL